MSYLNWGFLGPDTVISTRRTRTLGLGSVVRYFNERAVPGIGGIWYGKQLLYSILGIAVATKLRQAGLKTTNINSANAVEALVCRLAYEQNKWQSDSRLRGISKLHNVTDLTFQSVSRPGFYVTQPMRMASVRALPALGLVKSGSNRFNQYELSEYCLRKFKFLNESQGIYDENIFKDLISWAQNNKEIRNSLKSNLLKALSPLEPMEQKFIDFIEDILKAGGTNSSDTKRRCNARKWVDNLRHNPTQKLSWENRPATIDADHWHDLLSGAAFFDARNKSMQVLDAVELHLYKSSNNSIRHFDLSKSDVPESIKTAISMLRTASKKFLDLKHTEKTANQFCTECSSVDDKEVLRFLIARDNRVIRIVGSKIARGSEFTHAVHDNMTEDVIEEQPGIDDANKKTISWPKDISGRMVNLFLLNADLNKDLNQWIGIIPNSQTEQ